MSLPPATHSTSPSTCRCRLPALPSDILLRNGLVSSSTLASSYHFSAHTVDYAVPLQAIPRAVASTSMSFVEARTVDLSPLVRPGVARMERFSPEEPVTLPANALANGRWVGATPPALQSLSYVEQLVIAKYRHSFCVAQVTTSDRVYNTLPPPRADIEACLAILFVGSARPSDED
ncbi:hypothetical protein VTO73DRAFT_3522 [Trametes versicolor]